MKDAERIAALDTENARLREALTFYRDQWDWGPANMGMRHFVPSSELLDDRGEIARAALSPTETSGTAERAKRGEEG